MPNSLSSCGRPLILLRYDCLFVTGWRKGSSCLGGDYVHYQCLAHRIIHATSRNNMLALRPMITIVMYSYGTFLQVSN